MSAPTSVPTPFLEAPPPRHASAPVQGSGTFLVAAFREFYGELIRAKRRALAGGWPRDEASEDSIAPGPERPWEELHTLLERQALRAGRAGGDIGGELYRQAQYVMAALADDTFLHLDWSGREAWGENVLEAKLFGTHRAGEVVFTRLEALLRGRDPAYAELAQVYLMALALGFEGKLRDLPEGPALLAAYRRALHRFAFRRDPEVVRGFEAVAPQAYASTVSVGAGVRLPHFRRWIVAACVVLALWLVGGHLVWRDLTSGIRPLLDRILTDAQSVDASARALGNERSDAGEDG